MRTMSAIVIKQPAGIAPILAPTELATSAAQVATNCRFDAADLHSWDAPLQILPSLAKGVGVQTLYRFGQDVTDETQYWFHWLDQRFVEKMPIAVDTSEVTLFTDSGGLRVTDATLALTGGGTAYPINSYTLGIPAPSAAPGATVSGTPTDAEDPAFTRAYVYTWVGAVGALTRESAPSSPVSVTMQDGQDVDLTFSAAIPSGRNVTAMRIYRTAGTSGEYFFVTEVAAATVAHTDSLADTGLAEALPTLTSGEPPAADTLLAIHNSSAVVVDGQDVYWSEPFKPYDMPDGYRDTIKHAGTGVAAIGDLLVVGTKAFPYIYTGTDPAAISKRGLEEFPQACVSARSMVAGAGGVLYASPDGICLVSGGGGLLVTQSIFDRDAWQALKPESIHAYWFEGRYIGFYDTGAVQGGFILDPNDPRSPFTKLDVHATAGFVDKLRDALYLVVDGELVKWHAGATPLTYTWRSKVFVLPVPEKLNVLQVLGDYPVTVKIYQDGVLKHTATVADDDPVKLSGVRARARKYEIEVSGTARIHTLRLAGSVQELKRAAA